ncbi:hypothetical protein ACFE04_027450 [Oxalis oulophora]
MDAWADISNDIFFSICNKLTYLDIIIVSTVCKSWLSSGRLALPKIRRSPNAPWLMLSEEEDKQGRSNTNIVRQFFDLSNGKIRDINLPDTINTRCFGVGFGWLLTIDIDLQMNLLNPLSGHKINLPHYSTFDHYEGKFDELHEVGIWKAVASADPWNYETQSFNPDCVIMTIYALGMNVNRIASIAKLGDKTWTDDIQEEQCLIDVVYYKSQFYMTDNKTMYACNIDEHGIPSTYPITLEPNHYYYLKSYLVESAGELLLIWRYHTQNDSEEEIIDESDSEAEIEEDLEQILTTSFKVFKLIKKNDLKGDDQYECGFVEIKTLGNQALFLGDGASFSLCATSMNGCRSDCIYFTDDNVEYRRGVGGYDMGIYNLRDGTIEQHYKGKSLSFYSTPFWYI